MLKVGDKVVCIDDETSYTNKTKKYGINKYDIYTLVECDPNDSLVKISGSNTYYNRIRFISLKQYRKQKLYKLLCSK